MTAASCVECPIREKEKEFCDNTSVMTVSSDPETCMRTWQSEHACWENKQAHAANMHTWLQYYIHV